MICLIHLAYVEYGAHIQGGKKISLSRGPKKFTFVQMLFMLFAVSSPLRKDEILTDCNVN